MSHKCLVLFSSRRSSIIIKTYNRSQINAGSFIVCMLLLSVFSSSPTNMTDEYDRDPLCNKIPHNLLMECCSLSQNSLSEFCITNSSCGLAGRLLFQDEVFTYYWQSHRFINMVTMNHTVHFMVHGI